MSSLIYLTSWESLESNSVDYGDLDGISFMKFVEKHFTGDMFFKFHPKEFEGDIQNFICIQEVKMPKNCMILNRDADYYDYRDLYFRIEELIEYYSKFRKKLLKTLPKEVYTKNKYGDIVILDKKIQKQLDKDFKKYYLAKLKIWGFE